MALTVYLNNQYLPYEQALVPVEDRSFLFADGIYEVIRVYAGQPFKLEEHLERLARSAREIRLPAPDLGELQQICHTLIERNQLEADASVYIQISRGAYTPRTHQFPSGQQRPSVLVIARPIQVNQGLNLQGVSAITVPDTRWARCDIKSVSLLPNILAKQAATDAGAFEAILVKDGYAIEGSSTNFMAVLDGEIRTYPLCNYILGGITRSVVIDLARTLGHPVREEGLAVDALKLCSEAWVTSTTSEILPVIHIDGRPVGNGHPGPVALSLLEAYRKLTR